MVQASVNRSSRQSKAAGVTSVQMERVLGNMVAGPLFCCNPVCSKMTRSCHTNTHTHTRTRTRTHEQTCMAGIYMSFNIYLYIRILVSFPPCMNPCF
eukprot:COSAG05_NODE_280_length_12288_cov_4.797933_14_plen_97_part_00